jgi:hypothetical protein
LDWPGGGDSGTLFVLFPADGCIQTQNMGRVPIKLLDRVFENLFNGCFGMETGLIITGKKGAILR